jgi:hypothetical protein
VQLNHKARDEEMTLDEKRGEGKEEKRGEPKTVMGVAKATKRFPP